MNQKLWLTLITCLTYCVDKELYKAIDYLREQVRVLVEQQERQNHRILLTNSQRMRVAAKAKRLSRKMLEKCTVLFTPDTVLGWFRKLIAVKILTDYEGGFLKNKRCLIHDRDPLYTHDFRDLLKSSGVKSVKLPPQSLI